MPEISVGIVGGGAAGLFAGCFLKKEGVSFKILERKSLPGRKLLLTGHGRCNITNKKLPRELREGYHEAGSFIYSALNKFSPEDAIAFIESELNVPLKEEDNNRMFPESDKSQTIIDALVDYIGEENIITEFDVVDIDDNGLTHDIYAIDGRVMSFDKVILAAGGKSFPRTGSDGSSYKLARDLGHTITPLIPALSAVEVSPEDREFTAAVSGVSVNAGASLYYDNSKKAQGEGDVLFTHRGLSGPVIQELSREIPRDIASHDGWIELDFTPRITEEELHREFIEDIESGRNAKLINLVSKYVPSSVGAAIGERCGVSELYANDTNKKHRKAVVNELKHLQLHIDNPPSYEDAYVTRGGVSLKEIKRDTMQSKIDNNVYIIGEMLDIDGKSGGYNLQASMSEAFVAVKAIIG